MGLSLSIVQIHGASATTTAPEVHTQGSQPAVQHNTEVSQNLAKKNKVAKVSKDKKIKKDKAKINQAKKDHLKAQKAHMKSQQLHERRKRVQAMHQKNLARHHEHHSKGSALGGQHQHHPKLVKHIQAHQQGHKLSPKARKEIKAALAEKIKAGQSLTPHEQALHEHVIKLETQEHHAKARRGHQKLAKVTVPVARASAKL